MTPFLKLNLSSLNPPTSIEGLTLAQVAGAKERSRYKYTDTIPDQDIAEIRLYAIPNEVAEYMLKQLPQNILNIEVPKVYYMEVVCAGSASYLPPHIDKGRRCALNLYVDCAEEETIFYGDTQESFVAKNNEAWLLDVSKPHSVKFSADRKRIAYTFSFKHAKYEKLANILR